jgi:phosphohistidine phosphatase
MKTLILIRHAKSSWANPDQTDFERPLNERGRRDAPEMAKRLLKKNFSIDQIIYSTAARTTETMQTFQRMLNIDSKNCLPKDDLYHAPPCILAETIAQLDENINTVVIIGHNPGITEFANSLTNVRTDNMPTCSIFTVQSECLSWKNFQSVKKEFLFFDYPKLKTPGP